MRAVFLALFLAVIVRTGAFAQQATVKVDGSSTVYPLTEHAAEQLMERDKGVKVTVGISGNNGGFKKFIGGNIDIVGASRPIGPGEMKGCNLAGIRYIELPIAIDALAIVVNNQNKWAKSITMKELKAIWDPKAHGRIGSRDQVRAGWPAVPLELHGPGSDSAVFDHFTEAVVGKAKASRGDYAASEDDAAILRGVADSQGALAYMPHGFANPNQVTLLPIDDGQGNAILPDAKALAAGTYPLARPLFIYVNAQSLARREVDAYVRGLLQNGANNAAALKYTPLPKRVYQDGIERLTLKETGTAFGGKKTSTAEMETVMKRPLSAEPPDENADAKP